MVVFFFLWTISSNYTKHFSKQTEYRFQILTRASKCVFRMFMVVWNFYTFSHSVVGMFFFLAKTRQSYTSFMLDIYLNNDKWQPLELQTWVTNVSFTAYAMLIFCFFFLLLMYISYAPFFLLVFYGFFYFLCVCLRIINRSIWYQMNKCI